MMPERSAGHLVALLLIVLVSPWISIISYLGVVGLYVWPGATDVWARWFQHLNSSRLSYVERHGPMTDQILSKLGVKHGMRSLVIDAPPELVGVFDLSEVPATDEANRLFKYIHIFSTRQENLDAAFPHYKSQLRPDGMLWVSWPKGRRFGTDLTLKHIIRIGYNHGLVESKTISIDSNWSAIKFTFPKQGKHYNNSYGVLKAE